MNPTTVHLLLAAAAAALGGAVNAIAGGGTLITFPTLVAIGIPAITANATSSVALWPGSVASMWAYRDELTGARTWAVQFAVPSVLGGIAGAVLLLRTTEARFEALVPFLVLGATLLFMLQGPLSAWLRSRGMAAHPPSHLPADRSARAVLTPPPVSVLVYQFLVSVYGGYFGAGMGILMLAALGLMGLQNIHQMNGLKNWGAACINLVAVAIFSISGVVDWPVALVMAGGAMLGGYAGSRLAQRVSQRTVRRGVVMIGLASAIWLAFGGL